MSCSFRKTGKRGFPAPISRQPAPIVSVSYVYYGDILKAGACFSLLAGNLLSLCLRPKMLLRHTVRDPTNIFGFTKNEEERNRWVKSLPNAHLLTQGVRDLGKPGKPGIRKIPGKKWNLGPIGPYKIIPFIYFQNLITFLICVTRYVTLLTS